jgi:hypothetical protein
MTSAAVAHLVYVNGGTVLPAHEGTVLLLQLSICANEGGGSNTRGGWRLLRVPTDLGMRAHAVLLHGLASGVRVMFSLHLTRPASCACQPMQHAVKAAACACRACARACVHQRDGLHVLLEEHIRALSDIYRALYIPQGPALKPPAAQGGRAGSMASPRLAARAAPASNTTIAAHAHAESQSYLVTAACTSCGVAVLVSFMRTSTAQRLGSQL